MVVIILLIRDMFLRNFNLMFKFRVCNFLKFFNYFIKISDLILYGGIILN